MTGASRGFGRCLAVDFSRELDGDVDMFLWARNAADLSSTAALVKEAWNVKGAAAGSLSISRTVIDLSNPADYLSKYEEFVHLIKDAAYDRMFVVHNAGTLGELCYTQEWSNFEALDSYWQLNLTSVCWLNKRMLEVFGVEQGELSGKGSSDASHSSCRLIIMNITSLCAIEPFESNSLYCTGKAAREMHHRVIAKEQVPFGRVRVLNYSPGPMDTDMQRQLRENPKVHEPLRRMFAEMKSSGKLVAPEHSSSLGVRYILKDEYECGAHVDYYDIAPKE